MSPTARDAGIVLGAWLLFRALFFEGMWGYDDLYHVNFALDPQVPRDVWEGRLIFNGLLIAADRILGSNEVVWAFPALLGSLMLLGSAFFGGRALAGSAGGLLAGLLVAALPEDVTLSTDPVSNPLAGGFSAIGTALLLLGAEDRRRRLLSGVFFGLGVTTHLTLAFYFGPVLLAYWLTRPDKRSGLRSTIEIGLVAVATYLVVDGTLFGLLTGDPLFRRTLVLTTHLHDQPYNINPRHADGSLNAAWFLWSIYAFVATKGFGFVVGLPLIAAVWLRGRLTDTEKLLMWMLFAGWFYLNFGTQHPFGWAPLDRQTRYWHPLALPAVLAAAVVFRALATPKLRAAWALLMLAPLPLGLLGTGQWGQNYEISMELLDYAEARPDQRFVTDVYTFEEMFVGRARQTPANVTVFDDEVPTFGGLDLATRPALDSGPHTVLVNPLHIDRRRVAGFKARVEGADFEPISGTEYRTLVAFLPEDTLKSRDWFLKKPPGFVATIPAR